MLFLDLERQNKNLEKSLKDAKKTLEEFCSSVGQVQVLVNKDEVVIASSVGTSETKTCHTCFKKLPTSKIKSHLHFQTQN